MWKEEPIMGKKYGCESKCRPSRFMYQLQRAEDRNRRVRSHFLHYDFIGARDLMLKYRYSVRLGEKERDLSQ